MTGSDVIVFFLFVVDSVYNFENPELLTWDESIGVNQDLCFGCCCMNNFLTTEQHCLGQRVAMFLGHFVFVVSFCVMYCVVKCCLLLEKCIATVRVCDAQPFMLRCNCLSLFHSGVILSCHGSYWPLVSELG